MKKMQGSSAALLLVSMFVVAGCSKSGTPGAAGPSVDNLGQSLTGKWGRACTSTVSGTTTTNSLNSYSFDGANFEGTSNTFEDAQCAHKSMTAVFSGTYSLGAIGGSTTLAGATDYDFSGTQFSLTPRSTSVAGFMNQVAYCGFSDWTVDSTKVITANSACFASLQPQGHQIYQIKNGSLYLGSSSSSPNTRPAALDPNPYQPL